MPNAQLVLLYPDPAENQKYRSLESSGSDAAWRLITEARRLIAQPTSYFVQYDKRYPESATALSFVLENAHMVARAMDQATSLYLEEVKSSALQLRVSFIVLMLVSVVLEVLLGFITIRRAVNNHYLRIAASVQRLNSFSIKSITTQIRRLMAMRTTVADRETLSSDEGSESEESDSEMECDSSKSGHDLDSPKSSTNGKPKAKKPRNAAAAATKNDVRTSLQVQADELSDKAAIQKRSRILLVLTYWACMVIMSGILLALTYLCIVDVDSTEVASRDINAASRRRYLAERVRYLSTELVSAGSEGVKYGEDLLNGDISWARSLDVLRCALSRSAEAFLAVHYAVMYGDKAGWLDLAGSMGWSHGPVREWGRAGSMDMCSPFTWDKVAFDLARATAGSNGKSQVEPLENSDRMYDRSI